MMRIALFSGLWLVLGAPLAFAQIDLTGLERPLSLTLSPENPAPLDTVTLTIYTTALDLDRSQVIWFANKKEIARGGGLTSTTVRAGELGSETVVDVVAEDDAGIIGSARGIIRPGKVTILWESDSYVPPFYKGRVLPGTGATIRAAAYTQLARSGGTIIPEKDILYTWYKNDARLEGGRGRASIQTSGPSLYGSDRLKVVAEAADGSARSEALVIIPNSDPFVELYEYHPLFGPLFHRALVGEVLVAGSEQKVVAVPYFIHTNSLKSPDLQYEWRVNDVLIAPDPVAPNVLTVIANGVEGPITLALTLTSASDWFLRATGAWRMQLGDRASAFFNTDPFGASAQ